MSTMRLLSKNSDISHKEEKYDNSLILLVPEAGIEPARLQ